jgi:mannobiose 2-epimerase
MANPRATDASALDASTTALALADELELELERLLETWLPRCVDELHGGFLCDFDYRWRHVGPDRKTLEFQARMARLGAILTKAFPDEPLYREVAEHGFRYLHDTMWDAEYGGWYRLVDRAGHPLEGYTKHMHGSSYALSACTAYYEATSDPQALALAQQAFAWCDAHGHDERFGGYFNMFQRDGRLVLRGEDSPLENRERDTIGTPYGLKDANTSSDLLEALVDLYETWPDAKLRERLVELFLIVRDRIVVAPGAAHVILQPDWTPVPDFGHFAQSIHTANHLMEGSACLGLESDDRTRAVYKSVLDTVLRYGWDRKNGGIYFGGSTYGPIYTADTMLVFPQKVWWGQAEGMRGLIRLWRRFPDDERDYFARFRELWSYVQRHVVDARYGGWYREGMDSDPEAGTRPKASEWRDASHEVSSLLECIETLRSGA